MHCFILWNTHQKDFFTQIEKQTTKTHMTTQGAIQTGHHSVVKTLAGCCPTSADTESNRKVMFYEELKVPWKRNLGITCPWQNKQLLLNFSLFFSTFYFLPVGLVLFLFSSTIHGGIHSLKFSCLETFLPTVLEWSKHMIKCVILQND